MNYSDMKLLIDRLESVDERLDGILAKLAVLAEQGDDRAAAVALAAEVKAGTAALNGAIPKE